MINPANLICIFRREVGAYFNSAVAYIFIVVFVLINNGLFMTQFFLFSRAEMRPFFASLPFFLAIFIPAVTMRLWAEEKRGNTMELLLTFPMRPEELVFGKFLAGFVFYIAALAATMTLPIMLAALGNPDIGALAAAYVGAIFLGGFFLAIGIFISGLARDQIVAFILALMVCFGLHLIGTDFIASSVDSWLSGFGTLLRNYLGTAQHFDSFSRGVIEVRSAAYFVIGTLIFLVLNGFWIESRMRPRAKAIFSTAVLICSGIFFVTNWLFGEIPLGAADLTEGKLYTISPASRTILEDLKAPVTAKLYISSGEKMPTGMKTIEQEIKDKLDEFRSVSKGKFQYKIFHLETANLEGGGEDKMEQELAGKGIRPFQVQSVQADEVGVRLIYSAMSLAHKEKPEQVIPRIVPENIYQLEYLVVSRIYRMSLPEIPEIALVAPYEEKEVEAELKSQLEGKIPEAYKEDNYDVMQQALEYEGYKVSRIKLTEKELIPEKAKALAVVEPRELNERQKYEINRFVRGGGSLFLAVQNYEYKYTPSGDQLTVEPREKKPNVNALISPWGFEIDDQVLVDQQHDVISLGGAARIGPFELSIPVKIPIQIVIPQSGMNPNVSITSRLSTLFYLWGTAVKLNEEKTKSQNLKVETLLTSSVDSWTVPFQPGSMTPNNLKLQAGSRRGPLPLAVLVEGQFGDAYGGKTVPSWPGQETPTEDKSAESAPVEPLGPAPGKMILTGAAMWLQKNLIRNGGHLNFFLNSIDALALGEDLVTIRSKVPIDRNIGRVSGAAKIGWRFFVTLLTPVLLVVAGSLRLFFRRRAKQNYLNALALAES